jgi:hypothetical protein
MARVHILVLITVDYTLLVLFAGGYLFVIAFELGWQCIG